MVTNLFHKKEKSIWVAMGVALALAIIGMTVQFIFYRNDKAEKPEKNYDEYFQRLV
jgi:flagellar basal body-associated protein FliL